MTMLAAHEPFPFVDLQTANMRCWRRACAQPPEACDFFLYAANKIVITKLIADSDGDDEKGQDGSKNAICTGMA
jgi:hypothetical protein